MSKTRREGTGERRWLAPEESIRPSKGGGDYGRRTALARELRHHFKCHRPKRYTGQASTLSACPEESIRLSKGGGKIMADLLLWFVSFGIILNALD